MFPMLHGLRYFFRFNSCYSSKHRSLLRRDDNVTGLLFRLTPNYGIQNSVALREGCGPKLKASGFIVFIHR